MKISLFHELNMDDGESHGSVDVLKNDTRRSFIKLSIQSLKFSTLDSGKWVMADNLLVAKDVSDDLDFGY